MDLGTLVGMLGGTAVVLAAILLGGNFSSFVDVPSAFIVIGGGTCLLYTSPSPRDQRGSRMPSSA